MLQITLMQVPGRLRKSVAGRGLMSGSHRNEVPEDGWRSGTLPEPSGSFEGTDATWEGST